MNRDEAKLLQDKIEPILDQFIEILDETKKREQEEFLLCGLQVFVSKSFYLLYADEKHAEEALSHWSEYGKKEAKKEKQSARENIND